jgi:Family of unknown function (DUF6502)
MSSSRRSSRTAASVGALREVTVDDVIKNLLDLFATLGVDASHIATRVAKLDKAPPASRRMYSHAAAIGELLTAWYNDPSYLDSSGDPAPIRMYGANASFSRLAKRVAPNLDARWLLSQLKRIGAVATDENRLIQVKMRSLPVYEDRRLAIQHTLTSLEGFIKTLRHNLGSAPSNSEQLFHRIAWNGEFAAAELPGLKIRIKKSAQNFLESCDSWMMQKSKTAVRHSKRQRKLLQVSVGVYLSVDRPPDR